MPLASQLRPNLNAVIVGDDRPHTWTDERYPLIEIPDAYADPCTTGMVLAVGPGKITRRHVRIPIEVEVGDLVVFDPAHGLCYEDDEGTKVRVLAQEDLLAVIAAR